VASSRVGVCCCSFGLPPFKFGVSAFKDPFCAHFSIGLDFSVVLATHVMYLRGEWPCRVGSLHLHTPPHPPPKYL